MVLDATRHARGELAFFSMQEDLEGPKEQDFKARGEMMKNNFATTKWLVSCGLVLCAALAVSGCASSGQTSLPAVQEADDAMVTGCSFLGEVHGTSGWGGLAASVGIENAKKEALRKAAKKGATHVVWMNISGGFSPSVSGKAYKCTGSASK